MSKTAPRTRLDLVPWNSNFNTGIEVIDKQHRQLVVLINDLAHEYVHGREISEAERILDALVDYAAYHFETEEALWAEVLASENLVDDHMKSHNGFVKKIRAMQAKIKTKDGHKVIGSLLSFLTGWLAYHILYEDKLFSLIFIQARDGIDPDTAKQLAHNTIKEKTSALIQSVLVMYKKLSSRTLELEREAHSRKLAEQALLDQEQHWSSVLGAASDNLWDWEFETDEAMHIEQRLSADRFSQGDFSVHPEDWSELRQDFINHMLGLSDVFINQHRLIDIDGNNVRWVQSRGKIIEKNAAGHAIRVVGTQTDVTNRKKSELSLQRERDTRTLISEFATDFMASSTEDFDAAVNRALQRSGEHMQADRTYVFLISDDGHYINNTHEWCAVGIKSEIENLQDIPVGSLAWWLNQFRDNGYVLIPRVSDMPAEAQNEYHTLESQNIRSLYATPLYVEKELVGFMGSAAVGEERYWKTESIEFLGLMGDLLGIALGHRLLYQKRALAISHLERAEKRAQLGHWMVHPTSEKITWSQETFRIFERDPNTFSPSVESYFELIHPDERATMLSFYENSKASLSELHLEHRILLSGDRIKHVEVRGLFDEITGGFEGTVQDVTEKVQQREDLQRLAFEDSLTGLPNRRAIETILIKEMDYCERHNQRIILALLDLDDFRKINEQHGQALGDSLLKSLAQRIRLGLNETMMLARTGGDEFVVLFSRLQPEENYLQQLNRLLTIINQPLIIDGIEIALTASIGVTEFPQPVQMAGEQLLRQAQQALFQAKMLGKGLFHKYDIGSEQNARALTEHLDQVRKSLHNDEFVLHYQPKVNMKTGVVFGVEALVRWQKSTGELVMPGDFLPALHNHPLEVELGDWVIRTALTQLRSWKKLGLDIKVSVNVSSLQLFDDSFVEKLSQELENHSDISPSALQLEVLESSMLNDLEAVSKIMQRSRQLGVSFALDDFGTGYSSLAYLKHLPASVLKIDQSFVREMMESTDDLSIISGVIGMANAFGMHVIAEGIETVEQGNLLLRLGCEQGQGYNIAKPMPASEILNWVKFWKAAPSWIGQQSIEVQNLPLLYAEVEHRYWLTALEQWLHNERDEVPVLNHQQCKAGTWIDSEAHRRFGLSSKFFHLDKLHRNLHVLAESAVSMHAKGNSEAALVIMLQIQQQHALFLAEMKALIG